MRNSRSRSINTTALDIYIYILMIGLYLIVDCRIQGVTVVQYSTIYSVSMRDRPCPQRLCAVCVSAGGIKKRRWLAGRAQNASNRHGFYRQTISRVKYRIRSLSVMQSEGSVGVPWLHSDLSLTISLSRVDNRRVKIAR